MFYFMLFILFVLTFVLMYIQTQCDSFFFPVLSGLLLRALYILGGWCTSEQYFQSQTYSFLTLVQTGGEPNKACFISVTVF